MRMGSRLNSTLAILSLQFRLLLNNRSACLTFLMLMIAGVWIGRIAPTRPSKPTCYVMYWENDGWVAHLRSNLPAADDLAVEIVPVRRFTDANGTISYPPHSHSIQLRPPSSDSSHWTVWCWYDQNPKELEAGMQWFWKTSRDYWGDRLPIEVRVSSLAMQNPILQPMQKLAPNTGQNGLAGILLLLGVLFCAGYLQTAHLAEQIHDQVLPTILTKPVSIRQWISSVFVFHILLTVAVAGPTLLCSSWAAGVGQAIVATLITATGYCGLAGTAAFCSKSVANSTSLLVLYFFISGLALASSLLLPSLPIGALSAEWSLLSILGDDATSATTTFATARFWVTLVIWAIAWVATGCVAVRRFQR